MLVSMKFAIFFFFCLFLINFGIAVINPVAPYNQYDHFFIHDKTEWDTTATAFTLEFFWGGACQYNYRMANPNRLFIALPNPDYDNTHSGSCGKCLKVTTEHASIEVVAVDLCSHCVPQSAPGPIWGNVDLSARAFAIVADLEDDYNAWRADFDVFMTQWYIDNPGGAMPTANVDYQIWGGGPGSVDITLQHINCSLVAVANGNVFLRVKTKLADYIELIIVKSTLPIGQVNLYVGATPVINMINSRTNNVWTNSGSGRTWSNFGHTVDIEVIPTFFPKFAQRVTVNLPTTQVLSGNDLDDIDLGFQFPSQYVEDGSITRPPDPNEGFLKGGISLTLCIVIFVLLF